MSRERNGFRALVLAFFSALNLPARGEGAERVAVTVEETPDGREVRYVSGEVVYVEQLGGGRWIGRSWGFKADGAARGPLPEGADAFEIRIKYQPTPPADPGISLSAGWQWVAASKVQGSEGVSFQHFVVELANVGHPIGVKLHTLLDGTAILTRWLEVANRGGSPIALTACFPWTGRLWAGEAPISICRSQKWQVPWEGWIGWEALRAGRNAYRQDQGLVWDDPFFILRNEANGEYFFGQLAWPVNYVMEFQKEAGLTFKAGPSAAGSLRVIAPGESVTTPALHLGAIEEDFDAAVQEMHEHIRRSVLLPRLPDKAYLVQCLFPEDQLLTVYRGDDCNEANLKKFMEVCAAAGIELFILDGPTWAEGYGKWVPKKRWFPGGLEPLREFAHQKGLLFGVYAEVEGGRGRWEESEAWARHPEWFLQRNPDYPWRNFINLTVPEAAAYVESELDRIIVDYRLDIYRHDQNGCRGGEGSETFRAGFMENDYWRYYDAWHGIVDRARARYPDLILQQASGSGARLELATLAHWHENYSSDRASYPHVYQMLSGLTVYLPPETLVVPNGMAGNGRNQPDLVTMLRSVYTLGNTPMIFNAMLPKTVDEFRPGDLEKFLRYNRLYKSFIRPLLSTCKVYHHAPVSASGGVETGNWFAMEFSSPDRRRAWAVIIRLNPAESGAYLFKPKGLDPRRRYRMTSDNAGKTETVEGESRLRIGFSIKPPPETSSELLLFESE
ncbi:MAG: alpha-galactosidase [Planctomycetes bacterium]|nr:alpha-galactosidase [Planctomycetota bacterium]